MEGGNTKNFKLLIKPDLFDLKSGDPVPDFAMGVSSGNCTIMACFACNRHVMDRMGALIFAYYINIEREGDRERDTERDINSVSKVVDCATFQARTTYLQRRFISTCSDRSTHIVACL